MGEIIDKLQQILKTALGAKFATYRVGRPVQIGLSEMPLLAVFPRKTLQKRSGTVNDDAAFDIGIELIISHRTKPNAGPGRLSARPESQRDLVEIIEARDADGKPTDASIIGILNANISIGGKVLYTDNIEVAYDTFVAADGAGPQETATIAFTAHTRPASR